MQRFGKIARLSGGVATVVLAFATLAFSQGAHAAEDPHGWVGAELGMSNPDYSGTTMRSIYGITGGAKLGSNLGIGVYYLSSTNSESPPVGTFGYNLFGVDFGYYFDGEASGAYFGASLGMTKLTAGNSPNQVTTSPSHYGAFAGYNYMIGDRFSLGGELRYAAVGSSSGNNSAGNNVNVNSFNILSVMLTGKFWF
jgi:hypothetical protein